MNILMLASVFASRIMISAPATFVSVFSHMESDTFAPVWHEFNKPKNNSHFEAWQILSVRDIGLTFAPGFQLPSCSNAIWLDCFLFCAPQLQLKQGPVQEGDSAAHHVYSLPVWPIFSRLWGNDTKRDEIISKHVSVEACLGRCSPPPPFSFFKRRKTT